jgi:hypothetical protein
MTDTPETDAAWDESCPLKKLSDTEKREFARQLEREREKLKSALKVIHTWATFRDGIELVPEHVANLTSKALNLTNNGLRYKNIR